MNEDEREMTNGTHPPHLFRDIKSNGDIGSKMFSGPEKHTNKDKSQYCKDS